MSHSPTLPRRRDLTGASPLAPRHPLTALRARALACGAWLAVAAPLAASLAACATAGSAAPPARTIPDARVLTGAELNAQSPGLPLDVAVAQLRPSFAWRRGRAPTVYVDGLRYGSFDSLRELPSSWVVRIEVLDGPTATWRYGTNHSGVVLDVTTIRSRPAAD
jgi:hypothetical protein